MRAALLFVMLLTVSCYKDKNPNDGWCCAKSRKFCRPVQECVFPTSNYCYRYELQEHCEDLCVEWRELAGANGGACPAGAGAIKTPGCP
jgi:hypothetical protein